MSSEDPPFWWEKPDWRAWALSPISLTYRWVADRKLKNAEPPKLNVPVICVGNFTVGGSGKTPTAIALAECAKKMKLKPGFVSRGYGGHVTGLHLVDPKNDTARHVGDEPLLLAKTAPTMVGADRYAGALSLIEHGVNLIIMDDGFQSRRIHMDFALGAVDGTRGIGNGYVVPAGPLRGGMKTQMMFCDGLVINGEGEGAVELVRLAARGGKPVLKTYYKPSKRLAKIRYFAFAGIANPDKFFASLEQHGHEVIGTKSFPDHHQFRLEDLSELEKLAKKNDAMLVTTQKDAMRLLHGTEPEQRFMKNCAQFTVKLAFEDHDAPRRIIEAAQKAFRQRL